MKKTLAILGLLILSSGIVNAQPLYAPHNHKTPAPQHRVAPQPKPMPVVYQVPVMIPNYSNSYNNSPYVTFSLGNVDVTVGI